MTVGKPFEPGQSGNPGGRPKENAEVKRLAREHSPEAIERLVVWMRSKDAKASIPACNSVLDRAFGKPPQAIVGDDEQDPINIINRIVREIVEPNPETQSSEGISPATGPE